jgi:hypothetical protein
MSIVKIQEELKAPKNQRNSFGNYNYRSAEDIIEAVKPIAHKYGFYLNITDEVIEVGGRIYVKATATLISDDKKTLVGSTGWAREEETKKGMDGAQITGAASSYARKYALNGLLAIDDTKDADATNTHDKETPAVTVNRVSAQHVTPQPQQVAAVPKTEDNKPWLNKNNPKWSLIVQGFKAGNINIGGLRNEFKVSKALEAELLSLTN